MKLPSKALLYRDFKYSKYFMFLIFILLFIYWIPSGKYTVDWQWVERGESMSFSILLFTIASFMSVVLFNYDRRISSYTLSASMPFDRNEVITSKWLVALYNITFAHVSIYAMINVILILQVSWRMNFWHATKWVIVNLLMAYCIFGFITMIQSMNGSCIIGICISALMIIFPISLVYLVCGVFYIHYNNVLIPSLLEPIKNSDIIQWIYARLWSLFGMDPSQFDIPVREYFYEQGLTDFSFFLRCGIFVILTIVFYLASVKLYKHNKLEKNGHLIVIGKTEKLYKILIAYFIGVFLQNIYFWIIEGHAGNFRFGSFFNPDAILFFYIILPIPIYFLIGKLIKLYNRRFS